MNLRDQLVAPFIEVNSSGEIVQSVCMVVGTCKQPNFWITLKTNMGPFLIGQILLPWDIVGRTLQLLYSL